MIATGIVLGAFGAHALKEVLTEAKLTSFETGVRYQIYHGLAILLLGFNASRLEKGIRVSVWLLLSGVILFSGSIYFLSIESILGMSLGFLGPVTPIGGTLMIAGWVVLIVGVANSKSIKDN